MLALTILALFASLVFAVPNNKPQPEAPKAPEAPKVPACSLSKVEMSGLPSNQTQLVVPAATTKLSFVAIGVGVQNYTCASTGTFSSIGAVAELVDISCLNPETFDSATVLAFDLWKAAPKSITAQDLISDLSVIKSPIILGQHYFIKNPAVNGTGLSPKWDFTSASEKGHSNAFVVGAKAGDVPAPTDPTDNVDWLMLNDVEGDLATQIFRVQTHGGQPPKSCTPGNTSDISVKYASQYWLYGGDF